MSQFCLYSFFQANGAAALKRIGKVLANVYAAEKVGHNTADDTAEASSDDGSDDDSDYEDDEGFDEGFDWVSVRVYVDLNPKEP